MGSDTILPPAVRSAKLTYMHALCASFKVPLMQIQRVTTSIAVLGLLLSACATDGVVVVEPNERPYHYEREVSIPPGHMPPPGECRIWFTGRPAGQQPPPGDCGDLRHRVPPGAILIRG